VISFLIFRSIFRFKISINDFLQLKIANEPQFLIIKQKLRDKLNHLQHRAKVAVLFREIYILLKTLKFVKKVLPLCPCGFFNKSK